VVKDLMTGCASLVCADGQQSKRAVVEMIFELLDRPGDAYHRVTDRVGHDLHYTIDSAKLRTELGYQPKYAQFMARLFQTIDWWRADKAWWRPQKAATAAAHAV
jgi:dTDP-glucose 4,6-dehydratase